MEKLKVSIIGATGFTGKELIKILLNHKEVKLVHLTSTTYVGENINKIFPEFLNKLNKKLINLDLDVVSQDSDMVFTALPHTVSMDVVPELLKKGVKVVDLSADYRLKNSTVYKEWYKKELNQISKGLLSGAVYGLPEIYLDKIKDASLVANPGCYPTSVILGIAPLLKHHFVEPEGIIIDSKSGASGAGRKLSSGLHFAECNENFKAYKQKQQGTGIKVSFTPHLLPINRGILSTCYLSLKGSKKEEEVLEIYQKYYHKAPFVRIFEPPNLPEIKFVAGTNYCDIGFSIDERMGKIKIISVIDNLLKGAAGQAVQNMNIMSGFPETCGLV
jgi:N-acetyl-gamma-glutamyl-phosphate reductase